MSLGRGILGFVILVLVVAGLYVAGAWFRLYGEHEGAGEITASAIPEAVLEEQTCAQRRAAEARQNYVEGDAAGHLAVPGVEFEEWLDSGQSKDCFLPSFNYRPGGSCQYALAVTNFDDPTNPRRFRFGFIASSDNHRARPGTGYKEFDRKGTTEANGLRDESWRRRVAGRDTVYYVRAIEEPSVSVNAGHLRCRYDDSGNCLEVDPCYGDYRTDSSDDCTTPIEERAWSSPIYVDAAGSG